MRPTMARSPAAARAGPTRRPTGYAGTDSFAYSVNDGFGGTDTATVTIRIDPDTTIDSGPDRHAR